MRNLEWHAQRVLGALLVAVLALGVSGCWGGVYVTTAPIVDTQGHAGGVFRVGGTFGLAPEKYVSRVIGGHAALEVGGLTSHSQQYLGGGVLGGARLGFHIMQQFPKWFTSFDIDVLLYGRAIDHTLYGIGLTGHLLPTLVEQVARRYSLGVSILTDLWGEQGVRGVFGLGLTFALVDITPQSR